EIQRAMRERQDRMARERDEKIATLKARAKALRNEHKYVEAVEILDRIRLLDPKDSWAADQHSTLRRFVMLLEDKAAHRAAMTEEERQMVGIRRNMVPWFERLRYPRDWAEITLKRQPFGTGEGGESEANRAVHRALRQVLPKLNFSGIALG
ncbi:MAG: hypothetical protein ACYS5V_07385, partial [Planctomycetota bacterium]